MNCAVISFTKNGTELNRRLCRGLAREGHACQGSAFSRYAKEPEVVPLLEPLKEWTKRMFQNMDALVFIGATGIAVRSIAPFVRDKKTDPAVLVIDEQGSYVISLLSGHLGGANELALAAARILGAEPVITTATDRQGKFAVDVFAKKNRLAIVEMELAKEISARLVNGERVGLWSDFPFSGALPEELLQIKEREQNLDEKKQAGRPEAGICISLSETYCPFPVTLHLVPEIVTAGIGCRKGTKKESICRFVFQAMKKADISRHALCGVASIDVKAEEEGILSFCHEYGIPFWTFSSAELKAVSGTFTTSSFVQAKVGVDNVCERSAVLAGGKLIQKKQAGKGVTAAFAARDWRAEF